MHFFPSIIPISKMDLRQAFLLSGRIFRYISRQWVDKLIKSTWKVLLISTGCRNEPLVILNEKCFFTLKIHYLVKGCLRTRGLIAHLFWNAIYKFFSIWLRLEVRGKMHLPCISWQRIITVTCIIFFTTCHYIYAGYKKGYGWQTLKNIFIWNISNWLYI